MTLVLLSLCLVGCGRKEDVAVEVIRFERILLDTPEASLQSRLASFQKENPTPLIRVFPDDPYYMQMVAQYRSDSVVHVVDDTVQHYYGDLSWLQRQLADAMRRARSLDTAYRYNRFITYISNAGYASRVAADRATATATIAIDEYVTPHLQRFGYFGEPLYIVRLCGPEYIVPDCMAEIARQHIALPEDEMTLLDYMVAEGKVMHFLHEVLPATPDSILFRYTEEQMRWMTDNESNVWAYFVQQNMLYEHDYARLRNFVEDAPKTNAFHQSAPRTASYIGWQIVRRYAQSTSASFREIMENTDSRQILYQSGYRP